MSKYSPRGNWPFRDRNWPWYTVEQVTEPISKILHESGITSERIDHPRVRTQLGEEVAQFAVLVPGCTKEDVSVRFEDGMIKVLAEPNEKYDFDLNDVEVEFTVGTNIERNSIKATVADGILVIEAEYAKPVDESTNIVIE